MSALDDFKRFVSDSQAASYYGKWSSQNPGSASKWAAFRDALFAGQRPTPPDMGTNSYGRALVDAGVALLNSAGSTPDPTPIPNPSPTPAPAGRPFPATSAFNTLVPSSPPIHPDSARMIGTPSSPSHWTLAQGSAVRQWVGPRQRVPYVRLDASATPKTAVSVNYDDALGYGCGRHTVQVPIPQSILTLFSRDYATADHDASCWIVDAATGDAWETYCLTGPGVPTRDVSCDTTRWNALRADYWPAIEKSGNGYGDNYGASASKIKMGCGLLRPEDTQLPVGSDFGHALRVNGYPGSTGAVHPRWVHPAYSGDGEQADATGIPYGARLQLDPTIDVESYVTTSADTQGAGKTLPDWMKMILRTMQRYGCVLVDHSGPDGSGGIDSCHVATTRPYVFPWETDGTGWGYENGVPYSLMSRFRVIDWNQWTGV